MKEKEHVVDMDNGFSLFGWRENPFSFRIAPECYCGNIIQVETLLRSLHAGEKFSLVTGPTGSGKTTLFRLLLQKTPGTISALFLPKPPKTAGEWLVAFQPFLRTFFRSRQPTLFTLSDHLNKKLRGQHCFLFVDECHEATIDSLEWLRTLTDQVDGLQTVMAGLPVLESQLSMGLETLSRRITTHVQLAGLSKPETCELVKKRIEQQGGQETRPFTQAAIDAVFEKSGGFPREILRWCNELALHAAAQHQTIIDADFPLIQTNGAARPAVDELPDKQRVLLEALAQTPGSTPARLLSLLPEASYKDRDNAVRSANNLLKRLLNQGFVERSKAGKAYKYTIAQKYRTLFVKA